MKSNKKKIYFGLLIVLGLVFIGVQNIPAQGFNYQNDFKLIFEKTKDKQSGYYYPPLLKRFMANDPSLTELEMVALQIGFTGDKNYKAYTTLKQELEILALSADGKYAEVITASNKLLKKNPLSLTALFEKASASVHLNKPDAEIQVEKARKLIASILWTGDGGYDHPYFVLSPIDHQILIRYVFGATVLDSELGGDLVSFRLEVVEMELEGKKTKLHFIIQHFTE